MCVIGHLFGCCWVMQWMFPPPSRISRAGMPTTSRSGNSRRSVASAARIVRISKQRRDHPAVRDVEVDVRGRQTVTGTARQRPLHRLHPGRLLRGDDTGSG